MNEGSIRSDDRVMVALAYLLGALIALLVWATQKDRSRFVRFQSLQALAMDLVLILLAFLAMGVAMVGFSLVMGVAVSALREDPDAIFVLPMSFPLLMMCLVVPTGLIGWGLRLWGAIGAMNNPHFRFPLLGRWVERFLEE